MEHNCRQNIVMGDEVTFRTLGLQARMLWAKTDMGNDEQRGAWSPLYVHMADSAHVARHLWHEWLSVAERRIVIGAVNGNEATAEALVIWLAGVHDIGKATPNFQCKVSDRAEEVSTTGLDVPSLQLMHGESRPHAFMGEVILDDWLSERGWKYPSTYSCIVGGHHGAPPSSDGVLYGINGLKTASLNFPNEILGDSEWRLVQDELLDWMSVYSGMDMCEAELRACGLFQPVEVLLTGLVIMADWIASNTDFFPLSDGPVEMDDLCDRADLAWERLALPSVWQASELELGGSDAAERLFHKRFADLPREARLRPAQEAAVKAALHMDEPGLIIIEAPMGNGKTEASLLCAEILARRFGDGGIAYLLPTMATSNAMFSRVESWLELLAQASDVPPQTMQLLHSKAALNPDYARLRRWHGGWMGDGGSLDGEDERVIAHQWLGGRKRGLLASFVVGTVDQLLMAALKTRHVQLRHLGLAGKVVVIDEVHAYDAYMSTYLKRVLTWLGAYGVPTILLSATLPPERRMELMHAYRGHDGSSRGRPSKRRDIRPAPRLPSGKPAYPLVTSLARDKDVLPSYEACAIAGAGTDVCLDFLPDDDETLVQTLSDLLSEGGCACVLRDTVARAQATYRMLRESLCGVLDEAQVRLMHSRFIAADRLGNDAELLKLLGPDSSMRPSKLIVVGTQVIEQSLDIDFDVMITDIAPVDLLLQRMGRLHRHARGKGQCERPERLRRACCYVTGAEDWTVDPPTFACGVGKVYSEALLLRTVLALRDREDADGCVTVNLPHDIASLVESVYTEPAQGADDSTCSFVVPDAWQPAFDKAEDSMAKKRAEAINDAHIWLLDKPELHSPEDLVGWLSESLTVTDENVARATVRDSQESIEVIAVQEHDGELCVFPWVSNVDGGTPASRSLGSGEEVPVDDVARLAAICTVHLPPTLSGPCTAERVIKALETSCHVSGWQESRWLRGQLVLVFDEGGEATIDTGIAVHRLKYSQDTGLELVETKKGERG